MQQIRQGYIVSDNRILTRALYSQLWADAVGYTGAALPNLSSVPQKIKFIVFIDKFRVSFDFHWSTAFSGTTCHEKTKMASIFLTCLSEEEAAAP